MLDVASIRLNLKGFEKMLEDIQRAGGDIESATEEALHKSAACVEDELQKACAQSNVPESITSAIQTDVRWSGNRCMADVGWKLGSYDPNNISTGYKAVFLNYGTPKRAVKTDGIHVLLGENWTTDVKNRGAIAPRNFIRTAKDNSGKQVKKIQQETLNEILKGLGK